MQYARNDTLSVSTSSVLLANPRTKRTAIYVTNTGTSSVTIVKGDVPVTAGSGLIIAPNGGTWVETNDSGFTCWQGILFAIAGGATTLSISEQWEA